ncbi:MAG TPA: tetratricopeptide repeat protein [Pirellulales bacterium]|jgi:tetratricopeptide (TPR) repeat protein|nr:tetratricopeptide repeat protein [Pirellulales bacterium]
MRHRKFCIYFLAISVSSLFSAAAYAQTYKPGDKVMVKTWDAKLAESGKDVNTHIELGDIFTVTKTNGDWLWVSHGWIQKADVVPLAQAIAYFTAKIQNDPNDYRNYHNRAWACKKMGELDKAIADEGEAIRLYPTWAYFYNNRGMMWNAKGEYDIAITDYNEAIRRAPGDALCRNDRGEAYRHKGSYEKAIADYNEAIRLDPKHYWAYANRAWILATCPDEQFRDGVKAIESGSKACDLSDWRFADPIDTLAAAYAAKGDYDSAIRWETKAIDLGLESESDKKPEDLRARLELYKAGKPYREEPKAK